MGWAHAHAERPIDAPPAAVYTVLADYRTHHPRIMPAPPFSDLEVETGGVGAGTVFHITVRTAGRRQRLHTVDPHTVEPLTGVGHPHDR